VLRLISRILQNLGYDVLASDSPTKALSLAKEHPGDIALAITDVVMPEMTGWELSDRLRDIRPPIKTLYVSGYADETLVDDAPSKEGIDFLQKPFTPQQLAQAVRQAIDRQPNR
jgi:CheY-like chemotaxis protein